MANRIYNKQVSPKGYKRGGGVTGKKKNVIQKLRKKFLPTFGEQFDKAKKEGKKTFTSTRDDKTKGKLEYHTRTKAEEDKAKKKYTARERARAGDKSKQLTDRGAKFKLARKMGKKTFTHDGKTYSTLLKGEKPSKKMFELSGKTSKKIKKFIG
jgi:hypothetical protein